MRFSTGRERRQQSQPFRRARRERLPQASLTTKVFAKYHSHPLAARMTLVCLCEDESFVQRSSVPFIFVLNGSPLSVPGTLLPPVAVTRLQLFQIENSPSSNQILVYILHPADSTEQALSLLLSSAREQKQVGDGAAEAVAYKKIPLTVQAPLPFKSIQALTSTVSTFNYSSAASI